MPDERILAFLDQQYVAEEYSYRNEPLRHGARTFDKVTPLLLHRGGTRHIASVTQLAKSLKLPPPPQSCAQEERVAGTPLTVTASAASASASGSPDEASATPADASTSAAARTDRSPSRTAREKLGEREPLAKSAVLARLQHKVVVRG